MDYPPSMQFDVRPQDEVTESEMIASLVKFVKSSKLRIANPDYQTTRFYSAQWKIHGNVGYYRLPFGLIPAVKHNASPQKFYFRASGFKELNMSNFLLRAGVDDDLHEQTQRKTGFWGSQGAGFMIGCSNTGRFLLGQRSATVPEPGTWGGWGGALDQDELDPLTGALRELEEETGFHGPLSTRKLFLYRKGEFAFYNYLGVVQSEFQPKLSAETSQAGWFHFGDFPTPFHFGLLALLQDKQASALLQRFSNV